MKRINYIVLTFSLVAFGACTKLDLEPKSTTTPPVLFQDESAYKAFIARVYAGLAVPDNRAPPAQPTSPASTKAFPTTCASTGSGRN